MTYMYNYTQLRPGSDQLILFGNGVFDEYEYVILTKFFNVSFGILQIFHTCFKFPRVVLEISL
jgi:hypothetical protein